MKNYLFVIALFLAGTVWGQEARIIKLETLRKLMDEPSEKIRIINFWATWCAPCIKEMPLFEKITTGDHPDLEVILVSLDLDLDPNPEKVYRFISRKKIQSKVLILDEKDPNEWIDKVEKEWSGALPATIIINQKTGKRKFVEKELHEGDLQALIAEVRN